MKITILCATLLVGAIAVRAPAQAAAPDAASEFSRLDKNSDGKISIAEAKGKAELETRFETLDRNHDGFLSPDEYGQSGRGTPPVDPATAPGGSAGAQHMPRN